MAYIFYNPNPMGKHVTDCSIRMLCRLLNLSWLEAFDIVTSICRKEYCMPSSDKVWSTVLFANGYSKHVIPEDIPIGYTVKDFCIDHPVGKYAIKTSGHVIAVVDGDYYDSFDSGYKEPMYYFRKER